MSSAVDVIPSTLRAEGTYLDLGSGLEPAPGYTGVDFGVDGILHHDLFEGGKWPWEDESVDGLRAWHVIEHIPHGRVPIGTAWAKSLRKSPGKEPVLTEVSFTRTQDTFFWFFDEAFRIAKRGARFELAWPHPWHDHADQDPTHCRRIPIATLNYLSREGRRALRVSQYPVACDWHVVPGSVLQLGTNEELAPFQLWDPRAENGGINPDAARHVGTFHEIRATLIKP